MSVRKNITTRRRVRKCGDSVIRIRGVIPRAIFASLRSKAPRTLFIKFVVTRYINAEKARRFTVSCSKRWRTKRALHNAIVGHCVSRRLRVEHEGKTSDIESPFLRGRAKPSTRSHAEAMRTNFNEIIAPWQIARIFP